MGKGRPSFPRLSTAGALVIVSTLQSFWILAITYFATSDHQVKSRPGTQYVVDTWAYCPSVDGKEPTLREKMIVVHVIFWFVNGYIHIIEASAIVIGLFFQENNTSKPCRKSHMHVYELLVGQEHGYS